MRYLGMARLKIFLASLSILFVSYASANHSKVYTLNYGHQNGYPYEGENVIPLKAHLDQVYGQGSYCRQQLTAVRITAKSRQGQGQASIFTYGRYGQAVTIAGHPFQYDRFGGFYTYNLLIPANMILCSGEGTLQIYLRGNIRVKTVEVFTMYPQQPGQPGPGNPGPNYPGPNQPGPGNPGNPGPAYPGPGNPGTGRCDLVLELASAQPWEPHMGFQNGCGYGAPLTACIYNRVERCDGPYGSNTRIVAYNAYLQCVNAHLSCPRQY